MQKRLLNITVLTLFLSSSFLSFSQDSVQITPFKTVKNSQKFQTYFFKALSEKAIENYRVAIQNLEQCALLAPNNVAVLFEFSKNYFYLNQQLEAVSYAKKALAIEPNNQWLLKHLVSVYTKGNNFTEAISIQQKLAAINPNNNERLVLLYFQNNEPEKGKALLSKLEKAQLLTSNLKAVKNQFFKPTIKKTVKSNQSLSQLIESFKTDKNFETLSKIVSLTAKSNKALFLKYSGIGVTLFPTQAAFYLAYARALNKEKQFNKAIKILQNGIDFVIENKLLEADFYETFANSYNGLGNAAAANKNKNKAIALRKKNK